jgi:predicted Zn finger-like uncharacterized protein
MYTQCLDCLTIYKIAAESLQQSHGQFRCGHCGAVFDALPTLTALLPAGVVSELPRVASDPLPAVLSIPALRPVRQAPLEAPNDSMMISNFDLDVALRIDSGRIEPSFPSAFPLSSAELPIEAAASRDADWVEPDWVGFRPGDAAATPLKKPGVVKSSDSSPDLGREGRYAPVDPSMAAGRAHYDLGSTPTVKAPAKPSQAKPSANRPLVTPQSGFHAEVRREYVPEHAASASRWPWVIIACTLALALLVQLCLYQKRALLAHDDFRPLLEHSCALIGCVLPLREDLDQLKVLDSTVKPHPRVKGALLISASLTNLAPYAQNYPIVEVKLLSLTSSAVALRRFAPTSYLRDPAAIGAGIAANASLPIVFEVIDPGAAASGFEFSFLPGPDLAPDSAASP